MGLLQKDGKGNISWIRARLILEFENEEKAEHILKSLEADNYEFIKCQREGKRVVCESSSNKASTLLHTLDDFLSCIILSDEVYRNI
ncbi:MAG TPA: hypothetical protein ENL31_01975 [Candidatus Aciduliprofundum boonei]|uniref:Uncharacterized protein n=1 Tax=Candidatus Aciduliprofundum boonei TaxID=379547 RepID=A0A7J3T9W2_9ARCH|nr:hypothetical protein [Candidatus Aciduliprofundum boonei]